MVRSDDGVGIFVVARAAVGRQTLVDALVVTRATIRDAVSTLERKAGHVVIELRLRPEVLEMTLAATRELAVVIIFFDVTG